MRRYMGGEGKVGVQLEAGRLLRRTVVIPAVIAVWVVAPGTVTAGGPAPGGGASLPIRSRVELVPQPPPDTGSVPIQHRPASKVIVREAVALATYVTLPRKAAGHRLTLSWIVTKGGRVVFQVTHHPVIKRRHRVMRFVAHFAPTAAGTYLDTVHGELNGVSGGARSALTVTTGTGTLDTTFGEPEHLEIALAEVQFFACLKDDQIQMVFPAGPHGAYLVTTWYFRNHGRKDREMGSFIASYLGTTQRSATIAYPGIPGDVVPLGESFYGAQTFLVPRGRYPITLTWAGDRGDGPKARWVIRASNHPDRSRCTLP